MDAMPEQERIEQIRRVAMGSEVFWTSRRYARGTSARPGMLSCISN